MQQELLIAILAGLGGMLGWGFADFFAKKTIDKIGDITTLFWAQLIGIIPLSIFFLFNSNITLSQSDILFLLAFGIVSAVSYDILYKAFGKGQVSILSPIFASYAGVAVLFSAFLFGETIPQQRWWALGIIFLGILATGINPKGIGESIKQDIKKGLPEVLIALTVYSLWLIFWNDFVSDKTWLMILFVRIFAAMTIFIIARYKKINLNFKNKELWLYLTCIGLFDALAFSMVSIGFSLTTYTSIIVILTGAFSLPTIILARIFLKERLNKFQAAGGLIIIAGIVLLSLT